MAWAGGFSGNGMTREEFKKYLATIKVPSWLQFFVSHNTAAPYIKPPVLPSSRIKNLGNYYRNDKGWPSGPNLFVILDKVYVGTPLSTPGTNSPGFNGKSIGVETEGDYRPGKHDPFTGDGAIAWATTAWAFAELLAWAGKSPKEHLKLHREDPRTTHECPGAYIKKDWLIGLVSKEMGLKTPGVGAGAGGSAPKAPPPQIIDVKAIQTELNRVLNSGLVVDGVAGPLTVAEINKWLVSLNLAPTGVLGPWGYSVLQKAPNASVEPPVASEQTVNAMHISKRGLDLIKHFEGLRLQPYDDVGALAIGYGHSNRSKKPPIVTPDLRITEAEAEEILARDLIDYENRVKQSITLPTLNQSQFDALVSLAYNWGPGNLDRSTLKTLVNAGNHKAAEAEIRRILPDESKKHYKGILRRRNKEADLYAGK